MDKKYSKIPSPTVELKEKIHFFYSPCFAFLVGFVCFFTHCSHFLLDGTLYWDTAKIYTEFRDNLQALNHFGEIAWWFPHNQTGIPGYYHSILGIPSLVNPAFVLLGSLAWVLGKTGIQIHNFHPWYVIYFGFLIPTLLLLAAQSLTKRLWSSAYFTGLALVVIAFSPGITFHLSDIGYLEPTAYGLFFCAALIDYFRKGEDIKTYWRLVFAAALVTLSGSHAALYWNFFFLPFFLGGLLWLNRRSKFPNPGKLALLLGITSVLFPLILHAIVFFQGKDLVRSSLGLSQVYPFDRLAPGNPFEILIASVPGFGFDWNGDRTLWKLMPLSSAYHSSFHYLGLLTLPLFLYFLIRGGRTKRQFTFIFFVLFFGVIVLSAYSPWFGALLRLPTPLRSCNHFSDASLKAGGFLILVFGAIEGLRVFIRRKRRDNTLLLSLMVGSFLFSLYLYTSYLGHRTSENLSFGLFLFWHLIYGILFFWLLKERGKHLSQTLLLLLGVWAIDSSTQSYLWVRNIVQSKVMLNSGWPAYSKTDETLASDGIGLRVGQDRQFYTNLLLMYPAYFRWQLDRVDVQKWPYLSWGESKKLFIEKKTFNTLSLSVESEKAGPLIIKDAYSPYWKAKVDGRDFPIERALENYKALHLEAGRYQIRLFFSPPFVGTFVLISYVFLFLSCLFSIQVPTNALAFLTFSRAKALHR